MTHWHDLLIETICTEVGARPGRYLHEIRVVAPVPPSDVAASAQRLELALAKMGLDGVYVRVDVGDGPARVVAWRFEDGFAG
jgi:hypothetical protein